MATDISGRIELAPNAGLKGPHPSLTPSFLFKRVMPDGTEFVFGAKLELIDRAEIFDGQASRAVLHCWAEISTDDVPVGSELVVWYGREIGTASVDEVAPC